MRRFGSSKRTPAAISRPAPESPSPQSPWAEARIHVVSGTARNCVLTRSSTPRRARPAVANRLPAGAGPLPVARRMTPMSSTNDQFVDVPRREWMPPADRQRPHREIDDAGSPRLATQNGRLTSPGTQHRPQPAVSDPSTDVGVDTCEFRLEFAFAEIAAADIR